MALNAEQNKAATTLHGPVAIVAGAGSGKTTVLTHRAANLLRAGVSPSSLLVITFTNKAGAELRERLKTVVGDVAGQITAGTMHSFFLRSIIHTHAQLMKSFGFAGSRLAVLDAQGQHRLMKSLIREGGHELRHKLEAFGIQGASAVLAEISLAKNSGLTIRGYRASAAAAGGGDDEHIHLVADLWQQYFDRCKTDNCLDFDDILLFSHLLLKHKPQLAEQIGRRYSHIMVDEFQDTNPIQCQIIDAIARQTRNLCIVGDEKQSIYAFRAAKVDLMLDFQRRYTDATIISLNRNYRSSAPILVAANTIATAMKERITDGQLVPSAGHADSPVSALLANDDKQEGQGVAEAILRSNKNGEFAGEIACLYRSRSVKGSLERALINARIPYVVVGDLSLWERKEVLAAVALLRAAAVDDAQAWRYLVSLQKMGITVERLEKQAHESKIPFVTALKMAAGSGKHPALSELCHAIDQIATAAAPVTTYINAAKQYVGKLIDSWVEKTSREDMLAELDDNEDASASAEQLRQKLRTGRMQNLLSALEFVAETSNEGSSNLPDICDSVALLAAPTDKNARNNVQLMTIHAAKGLEWDRVFVVGCSQGLLPMEREGCIAEEERRLMYVAVTRARKHLTLTHADTRVTYGRPSDYEPSEYLELLMSAGAITQISNGDTFPVEHFGHKMNNNEDDSTSCRRDK